MYVVNWYIGSISFHSKEFDTLSEAAKDAVWLYNDKKASFITIDEGSTELWSLENDGIESISKYL